MIPYNLCNFSPRKKKKQKERHQTKLSITGIPCQETFLAFFQFSLKPTIYFRLLRKKEQKRVSKMWYVHMYMQQNSTIHTCVVIINHHIALTCGQCSQIGIASFTQITFCTLVALCYCRKLQFSERETGKNVSQQNLVNLILGAKHVLGHLTT